MERIIDVAQFIFEEYRKRTGCTINEMKLHKLLYFAQRESYAIMNEPLFEEKFEGWKYGPVCTVVRAKFSEADGIVSNTQPVSDESAYILNNIIEQYGSYESWALSKLTHKEISWQNSRKGLKDGENGDREMLLSDIAEDAKKVCPYDSVWDMYYDEFEDGEA
mgnify:CR=1 FL=1